MTNTYRFRADDIVIPADDIYVNDKLNRQPFVSAATELLASIQEPFVVALDAPWGSGKTTTFRMLEPALAKAGIVTVSFNAWEVDYATDPLVPLVATLHDRLLEIKGYDKSLDSSKIDKFKSLGGKIAKHAAVAGVKVATAGLIDVSGIADEVGKAISDAADKAGEGLTGDLIDYFKEEKLAASQFKKLLEELTNYVRFTKKDDDLPPPVVLLIDELDRCRPTFAVAMLERIKHFFSIPGLVFVLALDMKQLKASTQKVYGAEMDATEYLRRFVDLELRLPRADVGQLIGSMLTNCGADAFFKSRTHHMLRYDRDQILDMMKVLASTFDLAPRVVQRMISRIMLIIRQTRSTQYLDANLVVFLVFLRLRLPNIYYEILAGNITPNKAIQAVCSSTPSGKSFYESNDSKLIEAFLLLSATRKHRHRHEEMKTQFVRDVAALPADAKDQKSMRMRDVADYFRSINNEYLSRGFIALDDIDRRLNLVAEDATDMI